jgi:16S rRNA A1518/A1519 N6-dimethyltransferase RsmA/KsgA/DIM1 with predicted DNA glycosylase/AP lyase activity
VLWVLGIGGILMACFGFVLLRGAPYLPTLSRQVETALDLVALKPGQTLLELGCGDGKVLMAAAERGWNVVGYELNPILALVAWLRTRRYQGRVKVVWGDFWGRKWPEHDGIFVFLLDSFMEKLNTRIVQETGKNGKKIMLVSFAFQIPGRQPKAVKDGLYLYEY